MMARVTCLSVFFCTVQAHPAGSETFLLLDGKGAFVDGVAVCSDNLYEKFVNVLKEKGRESKVSLIYDSAISFSRVSDVRGMLQGVGLTNINVFYLGRDRVKMAELKFGDAAIVAPKVAQPSPQ